MSEQAAQEPTMEEILASIRRIISEDDPPAETEIRSDEDEGVFESDAETEALVAETAFETAVIDEREDVLELTQRYEEQAAVLAPEPELPPQAEPEISLQPGPDLAPEAAHEAAPIESPEPVVEPATEPAPFESIGDLDISERSEMVAEPPRFDSPPPAEVQPMNTLVSERAAAAAASAFSQLSQTVSPPADGRSLEDVVRELMRPMLKDWLDANLPKIVEAEVRAEVDRIVRLGGR